MRRPFAISVSSLWLMEIRMFWIASLRVSTLAFYKGCAVVLTR
jgi:hypothetical protein